MMGTLVHVQLYTFSYRKPVIQPQNMPKQLIGGRNGQNNGTLKWAHRSIQSVFGMYNM